MLFNFQGPNLLRCIEVFHRNSLFIIACRFEFVKLFFQDFLNRFGSASRNFPDWLTVWVPIGPLWCAALRQLNYNTTPTSFCQHLFSSFLTFFKKVAFSPFLLFLQRFFVLQFLPFPLFTFLLLSVIMYKSIQDMRP